MLCRGEDAGKYFGDMYSCFLGLCENLGEETSAERKAQKAERTGLNKHFRLCSSDIIGEV